MTGSASGGWEPGSIHGMVGVARENIELGCHAPSSCGIIMIFIRIYKYISGARNARCFFFFVVLGPRRIPVVV